MWTVHETMDLTARDATGSMRPSRESSMYTARWNGKENIYIMKDVPPLKEEPFITTTKDYISKISHQLCLTNFPGAENRAYMTTWKDLIQKLMDHEFLGSQLSGKHSIKKNVESIISGISDPNEQVVAIYNFVKNNMDWDGKYRVFAYEDIKEAFEQKKGNSAEINLILTLMLQKAGFDSYPLLISTRGHGQVMVPYPFYDQFNHIINYTKVGDNYYRLDATDHLRPYYLLDQNDLNGQGLVLNRYKTQWIDLTNPVVTKSSIASNLELSDDNILKVNLNCSDQGYAALNKRKKYHSKDESEFIKDEYIENLDDPVIDSVNFRNTDIIEENFESTIQFQTSSYVTNTGEQIFIEPMLMFNQKENPFESKERKMPIDFNYPFEETYVMNLTIPEGYEVSESPESVKFLLPENGGEFIYQTALNGNKLQLISNIKINKSLFMPDKYPFIKEFLDNIVSKQAEKIILSKAE